MANGRRKSVCRTDMFPWVFVSMGDGSTYGISIIPLFLERRKIDPVMDGTNEKKMFHAAIFVRQQAQYAGYMLEVLTS